MSFWTDHSFVSAWLPAGLSAGDGSAISTWSDAITTNHLTQTGSARPTQQSQNGLAFARLAGAQTMASPSFFTSAYDTAFTIAFAYRTLPSDQRVVICIGTGVPPAFHFGPQISGVQNELRILGTSVVIPWRANEDQSTVVVSYDGATIKCWYNGLLTTQARVSTMGLNGKKLTIGNLESGGYAMTGDIYAIAVRNSAVTSNSEGQLIHKELLTETRRECLNIVVEGNSLSTNDYATGWPALLPAIIGAQHRITNYSITSRTNTQIIAAVQAELSTSYNAACSHNVFLWWEATNSGYQDGHTAAQMLAEYSTIGNYARTATYDIIGTGDVISRANDTSFNAKRTDFNYQLQQVKNSIANFVIPFSEDARIGYFGAESNATYFNAGDLTHLTNTGQPIIAAGFAFNVLSALGDLQGVVQVDVTQTESGAITSASFASGTKVAATLDLANDTSGVYSAPALANAPTGSSSGSGAYACTWTINDGTTVLQNASVRFTEGSNTFTATTNSSGQCSMSLNAAVYTVSSAKDGYSFTPTTHEVTSTGSTHTHTFSMTTVSITPPALPSQSTGVLTALDAQGNPAVGVAINFILTAGPGTDGYSHSEAEFTLTSGTGGAVSGSFTRGATYEGWRTEGTTASFTVPDATSFTLPEILGGAS
jgi:hypothetical protein